MLIPYRIPYSLCFSRGPGPLRPPLDQLMLYLDQLDAETKVRYEKKLSILTPPLPPPPPPPPPPPWVSLNVHMVSGKTTIVAGPGSKLFFQVPTTLGQIHCFLPFAFKLLQPVWSQIRPNTLFRPDRGPNFLTFYRS